MLGGNGLWGTVDDPGKIMVLLARIELAWWNWLERRMGERWKRR